MSSKATDPFEEYLRKKKVEMLETKFRSEAEEEASQAKDEDDFRPPDTEDPEVEARLKEEVDEFFTTAKSAGAKHFSEAGTGLPDEKVEEIRDALEDVFEDEVGQPRPEAIEEDDQAFVDFFRQVRDEYPGQKRADGTIVEAPENPIDATAREAVTPEPEAGLPLDIDEPAPARPAVPAPPAAEAPPLPHTADVASSFGEVSTEDLVAVEVSAESTDGRLDLNDILTPPADDAELVQRVELLGRLVAKLVERMKLPENEIIEVLIKAGVEF